MQGVHAVLYETAPSFELIFFSLREQKYGWCLIYFRKLCKASIVLNAEGISDFKNVMVLLEYSYTIK